MPRSAKSSPRPLHSTADLARYVGLARSTVSRVLNRQPGIKPKTVALVERAMAETGFIPNAYPLLMLKRTRTGTIGLCVESFTTPVVVQKLSALQRKLREHGYTSLIEVYVPGGSDKILRHFHSMRVEAVVFIGHFVASELQERIRELNVRRTPHVVFDELGLAGANVVTLDRMRAMAEVTEHLLALGHRRLGLLGVSTAMSPQHERLRGLRAALAARRLDFARCVVPLEHSIARVDDVTYGAELTRAFLAHRPRPTALIALNDRIAVGAIHAAQDAGRVVPRDLSIVGFNNDELALACRPALTTIDQQVDKLVACAVEMLLAQLRDGAFARATMRAVRPLLVVRDSTARTPR